jgi:limonene-1,2-epoxide hydrolase
MSENQDVVTRFMASWKEGDLDGLMEFFSDDAVYENIPIAPVNVGKEAIRKTIAGFSGLAKSIEFIVHHQGETPDGLIMNERTDRFELEKGSIELRIMGAFEVKDGKITAWRDYFDMSQFQQQLAAAS